MSYIDREKLMEILHISDDCSNCLRSKYNGWCSEDSAFTWACECISDAPSADVEPVRHGEWIERKGELHPLEMDGVCSICGHTTSFYRFHNYCPNCGAKMDLDEVDK